MLNTKHLSEQEVAQCADAINGNAFNSLPEELREHLSHCDDCASEVMTVTEMAFDFSAHSMKSNILKISIGRKIAFFSAVAAVLVFVGFLFVQQYNFFKPLNQKLAKADTTYSHVADSVSVNQTDVIAKAQTEQDGTSDQNHIVEDSDTENMVLATYQPDAGLEKLFNNYASAYRGDEITVISDRVVRIPGSDSLRWNNPSNEILNVDIFNNKGSRILTLSTSNSGIKIPELDKGLYYWKLINQDFDLLFVGKIVVKKK